MAKEKVQKAEEELFTFVLHEHKVKMVNGDEIAVPRCSWGKELRILNLLKDVVKAVVDSGVLTGGGAAILDPASARLAAESQLRVQNATDEGEEPDPDDVRVITEMNQRILLENVKMILNIAQEVLTGGPEKLGKAVEILLEKDEDWVSDNLESEEMLDLVIPFLYAKRQSIGKILGRFALSKLFNPENQAA